MQDKENKLEQYILNHSEPEGNILSELNRKTNLSMLNPRMLSGHLQGKILKMLSNMIKPKYILEIGTFTGYSAICLASGLKKGGKLHTIDINDEIAYLAKDYFKKAKLNNKIVFHIGNAIDIIPELNIKFDLVYIDGDKREYCIYYNSVFQYLKKGGFIIADNVLWNGKVVEKIAENDEQTKGIIKFNDLVHADNRVENVIFPLRDGLMLLRKIKD